MPSSESLQQLPHGRWLQVRERRTPSGYTVGLRIDVSEIKRHAATLQAVVDNFPGGVSFFDSDLNLVVCNAQFRTLLELPDELFASGLPTLEMIFRANAERGEYGPGDPGPAGARAAGAGPPLRAASCSSASGPTAR